MSWDWNYDPRGDLSGWQRRWRREFAAQHARERARTRAETLAARAELAAARTGLPEHAESCRVGPGGVRVTPARLAQLAKVRAIGGRNCWRNVDAATRSTILSQRQRRRWARTSVEERHAVALALNDARWHRRDPTKIGPAGGIYK
jgi:hypothetical protein